RARRRARSGAQRRDGQSSRGWRGAGQRSHSRHRGTAIAVPAGRRRARAREGHGRATSVRGGVMQIALEDARDFARGAAFLGTGGGGDPYIGRLLLEQALRRSGPAQVIAADSLEDDALVMPIAGRGAPTVIVEKILGFAEGELALRTIEQRLGRKASAIMSAEIGGLNALYPVAIAAHLGLPVVDADGMGRAFPELQMVSFNIYGQ